MGLKLIISDYYNALVTIYSLLLSIHHTYTMPLYDVLGGIIEAFFIQYKSIS